MRPLCCLDDPSVPLILDTSVAININSTGCAARLLAALPHECFLVDVVVDELSQGYSNPSRATEVPSIWMARSPLKFVQLGERGLREFERLVSGDSVNTLDDGEAATISYAIQEGAAAIIDEQKAHRICSQRFPRLSSGSSLDIFAHPAVEEELGHQGLADAIYHALMNARMSVLAHHRDWVVSLIGRTRAAECRSLPRSVRETIDPSSKEVEM